MDRTRRMPTLRRSMSQTSRWPCVLWRTPRGMTLSRQCPSPHGCISRQHARWSQRRGARGWIACEGCPMAQQTCRGGTAGCPPCGTITAPDSEPAMLTSRCRKRCQHAHWPQTAWSTGMDRMRGRPTSWMNMLRWNDWLFILRRKSLGMTLRRPRSSLCCNCCQHAPQAPPPRSPGRVQL